MPGRGFSGPEARLLLRRERHATIATLDRETGYPYASLVNFATDLAGFPVIFISRLARHTANLLDNPQGSLLACGSPPARGDMLTGSRVTVIGNFEPVARQLVAERYGDHHPAARMYLNFEDFSFWKLHPRLVHGIAGFGRIETHEPERVFLDEQAVADFAELAASARAHLNEDHRKAVRSLIPKLLGWAEDDWRVTSIDPDGVLLEAAGDVRRIDLGRVALTADELRAAFVQLVRGEQF
ncbi:MAG: HugZ family protein [Hyphomicrobiales bacterium]